MTVDGIKAKYKYYVKFGYVTLAKIQGPQVLLCKL
jgi:hypothetical protein